MRNENIPPQSILTMQRQHVQQLIDALKGRGYQVIGPAIQQNAIVYDRIDSDGALPIGWTDEQDGGYYRLKKRDDGALFGYAVGPHSWKKFLFPSSLRLWQAKLSGNGFEFIEEEQDEARYAFIGMRSCELHAIAIQDRVFAGERYWTRTTAHCGNGCSWLR